MLDEVHTTLGWVGWTKKWYRVKTTDYYGMFEDVPGLPLGCRLRNHSPVRVQWPDGTITEHKLSMRAHIVSVQVDMNMHPDSALDRRLEIVVQIHGKKCRIPLRGMKVAFPVVDKSK